MSDEENNSNVSGIAGSVRVGFSINSILIFENEQLKIENSSLKERIKEMSENIKDQKTELLKKDAEISRLFNEEISILKDENKSLKEQNLILRNENNELKQKLELLQQSYNKLNEDHQILNNKFDKLDDDHKKLNSKFDKLDEDHKKLELDNQILNSQSFANDLKNNVIDYFIYINKDDELFSMFYQKKQVGKNLLVKIKRNDFFQFCNEFPESEEFEKIKERFSNFTLQKLILNDPSFKDLSYSRNNNNLTHSIKNVSYFKYDISQFLDYVKPQVDKMPSGIKDTHIMKLYDILNEYYNSMVKKSPAK